MIESMSVSILMVLLCTISPTVFCNEEDLLTYDQLLKKIDIGIKNNDDLKPLLITDDDILQEMSVPLEVKDVNQIGQYIAEAPVDFDQKKSLLMQIINDPSYAFDADDKMGIMLSTVNNLLDEEEQEAVLQLLLQMPHLIGETSLLFIAAHKAYKNVLPLFMQWKVKVEKTHPEFKKAFQQMIYRSLLNVLEDDDVQTLKIIQSLTGVVSKNYATALVWYMAHTGKGLSLLKDLKALHADVNVVHHGTTPLIEAVKRKDLGMVTALIESNADVNKIGGNEIGSPLQQALAEQDVAIEMLLRYAGAHE